MGLSARQTGPKAPAEEPSSRYRAHQDLGAQSMRAKEFDHVECVSVGGGVRGRL
jgi:hypothetical protein